MGYNTKFSLDWVNIRGDAEDEAIRKCVLSSEEAQYCLGEDAKSFQDSGKWYNCKDDLKQWSLKFPHVLFTLKGAGEETGDLWVAYAKAGKVQHEKAIITFNPWKNI